MPVLSPITIDYEEIEGSPVEDITRESFTATRTLKCAWDERFDLCQQLMGGVDSSGRYFLPAAYPDRHKALRTRQADTAGGMLVASHRLIRETPPMLDFDCPSCDKHYQVDDRHAGKTTTCKACGHQLRIPPAVEPNDTDELARAAADAGNPQPLTTQPSEPARPSRRRRSSNAKPISKTPIIATGVGCLLLGFLGGWIGGREYLKYEVKSAITSAFSGLGDDDEQADDSGNKPSGSSPLSDWSRDRKASQLASAKASLDETKAEVDSLTQQRDQLAGIEVSGISVKTEESRFRGTVTAIAFTVSNKMPHAIARFDFRGTITSPGRSIPWEAWRSRIDIPGGLEPGETKTFDQSYDLDGVKEAPADTTLTATLDITGATGPSGEPAYDIDDLADKLERVEELQQQIKEIEAELD